MNDYYPAGAEHDPRAPWNEVQIPSEIIKKRMYVIIAIDVEAECDYHWEDDGMSTWIEYDLDSVDWNDVIDGEGIAKLVNNKRPNTNAEFIDWDWAD